MTRILRKLAALVILFAVFGTSHAFAYRPEDIIFSIKFLLGRQTIYVSDGKAFCDSDRDRDPTPISGYELDISDSAKFFFSTTGTVIFHRDLGSGCYGGEWIALDIFRDKATELKLKGPPCDEVVRIQISGDQNYSRNLNKRNIVMKFTQFHGTVTKIVFRAHHDPVVK